MKGAKGLELPINMIIVIAIAVLVLVVISAFFAGQTGRGINTIQLEDAFNRGCTTWRTTYNCVSSPTFTVPNFREPGASTDAQMLRVCQLKGFPNTDYSSSSYDLPDSCQKACGCTRPV